MVKTDLEAWFHWSESAGSWIPAMGPGYGTKSGAEVGDIDKDEYFASNSFPGVGSGWSDWSYSGIMNYASVEDIKHWLQKATLDGRITETGDVADIYGEIEVEYRIAGGSWTKFGSTWGNITNSSYQLHTFTDDIETDFQQTFEVRARCRIYIVCGVGGCGGSCYFRNFRLNERGFKQRGIDLG